MALNVNMQLFLYDQNVNLIVQYLYWPLVQVNTSAKMLTSYNI